MAQDAEVDRNSNKDEFNRFSGPPAITPPGFRGGAEAAGAGGKLLALPEFDNPDHPMNALNARERKLILAYFNGARLKDLTEVTGWKYTYVRQIVQGKARKHVLKAMQWLLTFAGLDHVTLAKRISEIAHGAYKAQWNKATEDWDYFPDFAQQLGAVKEALKIHELEPDRQPHSQTPVVSINFETNLGAPEKEVPKGTYEVELVTDGDSDPNRG